jgi:hypothetical protein
MSHANLGFDQTGAGVRIVVDQLFRMGGLLQCVGIMIGGECDQEQIVVRKGIAGTQA